MKVLNFEQFKINLLLRVIVKFLKNTQQCDSIFTTKTQQTFFWYKKKPINYVPKLLPRSQDLNPIVF